MPGIWLSDDDFRQTSGALWAQNQMAQLGQSVQQHVQDVGDAAQKVSQGIIPQQPLTPLPGTAPPSPTPLPSAAPSPTPTPTPPTPTAQPTANPGDDWAKSVLGNVWASSTMQNLLKSTSPDVQQGLQQATSALPSNIQSALGVTPVPDTQAPAPAVSPPPDMSQAPAATTSGPTATTTPTAPPDRSMSLQDYARAAAQRAGVDPNVFAAQIQQESGFQPTKPDGTPLTSPAGAIGIAQFMPDTAKGLGIDPTDPYASLDAAAKEDAARLQQYGGDWGKTLASYNAGAGAVAQYGGIPPFAETQNYVKTIMGNAQKAADAAGTTISSAVSSGIDTAKQAVGNAITTGQTAVNTAVQGVQSAVARTSQFAMGLSSGDAMNFCGPAAAMAFAESFGRNPTVEEAKQLAQQVGWTQGQGMAGPSSEVALLKTMGIDAHMTSGVDWSQVGRDAAGGNPVILDTPGHYFYVDGYNQQTGQLHLGSSATDLIAAKGQEWFTPDQIGSLGMGQVRAAIFADHPLAQQDGLAQSAASQNFTMGPNQPAGPDQSQSTTGPLGIPLPAAGQSPHPMPGQPGGLVTPPGDYNPAPGSLASLLFQPTGNAVSATAQGAQSALGDQSKQLLDTLSDTSGGLQQKAQDTMDAVLQVGSQNPPTSDFGSMLRPDQTTGPSAIDQLGQGLNDFGNSGLGQAANIISSPKAAMSALSGAISGNLDTDQLGQDIGSSGLNQFRQSAFPSILDPGYKADARDPEAAVGAVAALGLPANLRSTLRAYQVGNMIASPATLAHVAATSTVAPVWSLISRGAEDLNPLMGGTNLSRVQGSLVGATVGLTNGFSDFAKGMAAVYGRAGASTGPLARVWQTAGALHNAFQNAARGAIMSIEYGRNAGAEATAAGLQGTDWASHVASRVATPDPGWAAPAMTLADRATLRGELGSIGGGIGKAVQNDPTGVLGALFPIYNIGMNHLTQLVEASPLGAAGTLYDVGRAAVGQGPYRGGNWQAPLSSAVTPLNQRITNNLIGTSLAVWLGSKAADGTVTGNGPQDPAQRRVWLADGNVPNAVRLPGVGYVPSAYLPPEFAGPLAAAGAYADAQLAAKSKPPAGTDPRDFNPVPVAAEALVRSAAELIASKTPLQTIGQFWDLVHSPDPAQALKAGGASMAANIASSYIPQSSVLRGIAGAMDPNARQATPGDIGQYIEQGIPGLRQNVPQQIDALGRAVQNPNAGLGMFMPPGARGSESPIGDALEAAGVGVSAPPPTLSWNGQTIQMNAQEKQAYQQAEGAQLQKVVGTIIASPGFQALQAQAQSSDKATAAQATMRMRNMLTPPVTAARAYAQAQTLKTIPVSDRVARARYTTGPNAPAYGYGYGATPSDIYGSQQHLQDQQSGAQAMLASLGAQ